jgi:hypothetical protein
MISAWNPVAKVRRDSELIKAIEEETLKTAHLRVMLPLFRTRRKAQLPPLTVCSNCFEKLPHYIMAGFDLTTSQFIAKTLSYIK